MKTEMSHIDSGIHLPQWPHLARNQRRVNCAIWKLADDGGTQGKGRPRRSRNPPLTDRRPIETASCIKKWHFFALVFLQFIRPPLPLSPLFVFGRWQQIDGGAAE